MEYLVYLLFLFYVLHSSDAVNIYPYLNDPSSHPDYERYIVKHPTYSTFGGKPQFEALRSFQIENLHVVNYQQDIDKYLLQSDTSLGTVIWPQYPLLYTDNVREVIDYIASKNLFVTGFWGFVPGSGPGNGSRYQESFPQEFHPPEDVLAYLQQALGERWFGMSAGEQDGRYIGSYSHEMMPTNGDKIQQYLNFRMHFKGIEDILGPKMFMLHGLPMPHYILKTGLYVIVGAETAQGLPNAQIFYAFIRGAGKQYGVLWMGNVSIYNRFGYKVYTNSTHQQDHPSNDKPNDNSTPTEYACNSQAYDGPTCGTSLNLMKRLMYSHIMYNCAYMGFENGWFIGSTDSLSPIGLIQRAAKQWLDNFGTVGTHLATVALLMDFYAGWNPPRHFYDTVLCVWSNLPYSEGDYLTDNIFQIFYPRYQDCSYFHDETGFSSPTPYGDTLDVLLTDAALSDMQRYDTIIVTGELQYTKELAENLEAFITHGGNVIITANNFVLFQKDFYTFLKVTIDVNSCQSYPAMKTVSVNISGLHNITEPYAMSVCDSYYDEGNLQVLAQMEDGKPLAFLWQESSSNSGYVLIFTTPYAISSELVNKPTTQVDVPMLPAFPLLYHAQIITNHFLTRTSIFHLENANLSYIVNCMNNTEYLVLVTNPLMSQQPLKFNSPVGYITKITEHQLDQSEKDKIGYLPDGYQGTDLGKSTNTTIAGVDTRLFTISLQTNSVKIINKVTPKPPPNGIVLHLWQIRDSLMNEIHHRPTFFQHYDSVIVDYSYVMSKDDDFLQEEAKWFNQQNLKVYIDASPAIDLFPNLRLVNNSVVDFNKSFNELQRLLQKAEIYTVTNLIISLHRIPENDITYSATLQGFNDTLHSLVQLANARNIKIHMQDSIKNPTGSIGITYQWLQNCGLGGSIKVAPNLALLMAQSLSDISVVIKDAPLFFLNAPKDDLYGYCYTVNGPIYDQATTVAKRLNELCSIRSCPYQASQKVSNVIPLVIDAYFSNEDEEYQDVKWLEMFLIKGNSRVL